MNKETFAEGFMDELEKIGVAAGLGLGGTATCVCPSCKHEQKHVRGIPCNKTKCAKCGKMMVGKGMPHGLGKGVKK